MALVCTVASGMHEGRSVYSARQWDKGEDIGWSYQKRDVMVVLILRTTRALHGLSGIGWCMK